MENENAIVLNWDDMDRDHKIKAEAARLREILHDVPKQQISLVERLIDRAAFMLVTLQDYEKAITEEGIITDMPQGDYSIRRENPAARGYNTLVKNYQGVIRQLTDLLPDRKEAAADAAGERLRRFTGMKK